MTRFSNSQVHEVVCPSCKRLAQIAADEGMELHEGHTVAIVKRLAQQVVSVREEVGSEGGGEDEALTLWQTILDACCDLETGLNFDEDSEQTVMEVMRSLEIPL